jgi:hypothetical protein
MQPIRSRVRFAVSGWLADRGIHTLRKALFVAAVSAALFICGQSQAAVVLDQYSVPQSGVVASQGAVGSSIEGAPLGYPFGQNFTVGLTGTLSEIDLGVFHGFFSPADGFYFSLLNGGGSVLLSQHVAAADVPVLSLGASTWDQIPTIDLSGLHLQVTAGDHLSFEIISETEADPNDFMLYAVDNTPLSYAGGSSFLVVGGGKLPTTATYAFRTYVDPVPEPAAWALMLIGFGATGAMLRRSRPVVA